MPEWDGSTLRYVTIIVVALVLWLIVSRFRRKGYEDASAGLEQEAVTRGWKFHSSISSDGQRLQYEGTSDGIDWTMEAHESRGRRFRNRTVGGGGSTRWETKAVKLPGEMVVILTSGYRRWNRASKAAARPYFKDVLNADRDEMDLFKSAQEVRVGSDEFRDRYVVLASSEAAARQLLHAKAEAALMEWKPATGWNSGEVYLIAFRGQGLLMRLTGLVTDMSVLERLVRTGLALAHR